MFEKCTCGHTRAAHKSDGTGECAVGICNCRAFAPTDEPQTLVVEQAHAVCGVPNGFGPYSHVTCSYPEGHGRLSIADDPEPQEADHGNPDAAIWWDEEACDHSAGFTNADGPLVCSSCGTPYSQTRPGLTAEQVEDLVDQQSSSYADGDTPPPFILPYIPAPEQAPTIPTDLKGYLVIHAGDIKAGDLVMVIQDEGGGLRLEPVSEFSARSQLLQRIYDAIDKGREDHEFDTDCATDAVQELFTELLRELDVYYSGAGQPQTLAQLVNMVLEGRWIK